MNRNRLPGWQRATLVSVLAIVALLGAGTMSFAIGQRGAIPPGRYRGTLSLGDRLVLVQMHISRSDEPRIQIAAPVGFDDTTSRRMLRDTSGDTLLAVLPGVPDTFRLVPRLEGEALRGTVRQGAILGTIALRRVIELPLDVITPRLGEYRLDDGTLFSVGGGENAFDGLTYLHFGTGRTGSLFAVDSNRFIAGPRRYDTDPENYVVQFEPGDRIVITSADGQRWRGTRTVFYREHEVQIPTTGDVQLAATFTVPTTGGAEPYPAVILLHGSDPHYRFRGNVVTFFASRGIAVLSWDKRGNFGSGGTLQTVTIDTMAVDGEAAIRWLRRRPEVDPKLIGVWAISQGGWPASIIAARDSSLAFVFLHAGSSLTPAIQGEDEMRLIVSVAGGTQGAADTLVAYYRLYGDVRGGRATQDSLEKVYRTLRAAGTRFIWSPANITSPRSRWLAGIQDFDPVPHWSTSRVPVLAMFAEFDGYVPPETNVPVFRAAFARSGNRDTTIVVFPGANHRFEASSQRRITDWVLGSRYLTEYYDTMARWLDARITRQKK
jgi:dienelactone hydrolase